MSITHLKEHQQKAIGTLEAILSLCEKENISYFISGGALIGAIRHQGFIPWDDDIDICIPRPDYERLLALTEQLPAPFEILHSGNDSEFIYPFAKAYDASTTVTEDFQKPFTRGVWVDIFPLDGTFENRTLRKLQFFAARRLISILVDQQQFYKQPKSRLKKLRKSIKSRVYRLIPKQKLIAALNKICSIKKYEEANYVTLLVGKWGDRESAPKHYFERYKTLPFEHLTVRGPDGADPWLRQVFGDYMTPPPIDARHTTHLMKYVNLALPYREYLASREHSASAREEHSKALTSE